MNTLFIGQIVFVNSGEWTGYFAEVIKIFWIEKQAYCQLKVLDDDGCFLEETIVNHEKLEV